MSHHDKPLTLLGDLTPADFLANYWQQKPLLIRGAIPDFVSPIDPTSWQVLPANRASKRGWSKRTAPTAPGRSRTGRSTTPLSSGCRKVTGAC